MSMLRPAGARPHAAHRNTASKPALAVNPFTRSGTGMPHAIVNKSVHAAELPPGAIRRTARSVAGPNPQTTDRHQGYPYRHDYRAVPSVHGKSQGNGYRSQRRIRLHGRHSDPYQVQNAPPPRPGTEERR